MKKITFISNWDFQILFIDVLCKSFGVIFTSLEHVNIKCNDMFQPGHYHSKLEIFM